jgi:transposase
MAHVHAWEFYGGAAAVTVPDNLKAGVTKACFYDPVINPSYAELASHYRSVVLPTRTYKPKDKAAVEAGVLQVERWVLAPLRNRQFFSLAELNRAITAKVAELNARVFRGGPTSRAELFADLERPALRPLPDQGWELAEWKNVTVNIDYHVEYDHRFYSVPYRLVRQRLEIRATASTVEVLKGSKRVASHARQYGRCRYVTDPDHMPAAHRAHAEWTPSRMIDWAATVSLSMAALVEKLLETRPHPEHAYRACLGLMSLARRYGNDRAGAAASRALASGAISYSSVKSILAEGLDRIPLQQPEQVPLPLEHENLRGADYYRDNQPEEA